MLSVMVLFSIGFLVSITLMFVLRPIALRLGLVDMPGGRKTHCGEVPVIGGLAMFFGLLVASLVGVIETGLAAPLLATSALMVVVGMLDDLFDLPPNVRLLAHTSAAATLVLATGFTVPSLGDLLGFGQIRLGILAWPFTVISAIALINAFNMLDGMDGLAGGVGVVPLAGFGLAFGLAGHWAGAAFATAILGAVLAFLIFNVPAGFNRGVLAFMGDAGSTLLGFLLAGLGLAAVQPDVAAIQPIVMLWLMPIPIFELFVSTFRRLFHGRSPLRADRGHFHHALLKAGVPVRTIFFMYLAVSILLAGIGLAGAAAGVGEPVLFFGFLVAGALWVAGVHNAHVVTGLLSAGSVRRELPPDVAPVSVPQAQSDAS
jgi:UDP-GlcNAc:undecaprenyl-phosphate GlcNAc-1-phosphate transferase